MLSYQTQHHHLVMQLTTLQELVLQTYHSSKTKIKRGDFYSPFFYDR